MFKFFPASRFLAPILHIPCCAISTAAVLSALVPAVINGQVLFASLTARPVFTVLLGHVCSLNNSFSRVLPALESFRVALLFICQGAMMKKSFINIEITHQ